MRRHGRRRPQQRAQAAHARRGKERTPARRRSPPTRARHAQGDRASRPVRQTHQQAALAAHHPMPLHRKRVPHKRMSGLDDHHLRGPRSAQLTQSVRIFVIYRKLSHGTQSDDGERFIERALSVSVTCRLQARSMFAYMRELLNAHVRGDPLPTVA
jgi:hypothetical protein